MSPPPALTGTATVKMTTNFGDIVIKVDSKLGPHAAGAFVALARCGYYNNIIFHRVVPTFIIQAGDGIYGRMPNPTLTHLLGTGGPGLPEAPFDHGMAAFQPSAVGIEIVFREGQTPT